MAVKYVFKIISEKEKIFNKYAPFTLSYYYCVHDVFNVVLYRYYWLLLFYLVAISLEHIFMNFPM